MQQTERENRRNTREVPSLSKAAYADDDNVAFQLYALLTKENKEKVNRYVASLKEA